MLNSRLMGGRNADRGLGSLPWPNPYLRLLGGTSAKSVSSSPCARRENDLVTCHGPAAGGPALAGDRSRLPLKYLLWFDNSAFINSSVQLTPLLLTLFINCGVCCVRGSRWGGGGRLHYWLEREPWHPRGCQTPGTGADLAPADAGVRKRRHAAGGIAGSRAWHTG